MSYKDAQALLNRGVSRPTLYSLLLPNRFGINGTGGNNGIRTETNDYLQLFCKTVAVPESSLSTTNANAHEYMGITRETPVNMLYGKPLSITVIENSEFSNYRDIRRWMDRTTQNANQGTNGRIGVGRNQRMQYYNSFVGDIQLAKLEFPEGSERGADAFNLAYVNQYREAFRVHFINAYPINLGEIVMGSEMTDAFTEFKVDFTYESYHLDYSNTIDRDS